MKNKKQWLIKLLIVLFMVSVPTTVILLWKLFKKYEKYADIYISEKVQFWKQMHSLSRTVKTYSG
jgi:hypothetical protein